MKKIYLLTILLCLAFQSHSDEPISFKSFVQKYGKFYNSSKEFKRRSEIFEINLRRILEHNKYAEANNISFRMGVNAFTDYEDSEFLSTHSGYIPLNQTNYYLMLEKSSLTRIARLSTPKSKNWVKLGKVVEIKNQGKCNSCWAFAIVAVIESYYAIRGYPLTPFSEQQLVDCSESDNGCVGGNPYVASIYTLKNGIMRQKDYPYLEKKSKCRFSIGKAFLARPVGGYVLSDESFMQTVVGTQGPVSVAIFAGHKFRFYVSGLLQDPCCLDPITYRPNHTVTVVGYGMDKNGNKYWLGRNSWGADWGMSGYFKMPRGVNYCGIKSEPTYVYF